MQNTIRGDDVHNINAKISAEPNSPEARWVGNESGREGFISPLHVRVASAPLHGKEIACIFEH